jgi:hypothetical protein
MLTEKDYCDYETRNELIKLGYPAHLYDNTEVDKILGAILLYEAQKFLREEKKLVVLVGFDFCPNTSEIVYNWVIVVNGNTAKISSYTYDDFEEALSEGIKEAVKILKEK